MKEFVMNRMKMMIYCVCLFVIAVSSTQAVIEGDIELLRYIADGYETSWEQLRTWGGEAETTFISSGGTPPPYPRDWKRCNHAVFLIDRDAEAVRWNVGIEEIILDHDKEQNKKLQDYSGMTKNNRAFQMFYNTKNEKLVRTLEVGPEDNIIKNVTGFSFDPIYILQKDVFPDLPNKLRFYYEKAKSPKIGECKIIRDGDIVKFEVKLITEGSNYENINRFTFDLSQGCNLLELYASGEQTDVQWRLDYEKVRDVFIPKKISRNYVNKTPGSESKSQFNAVFNNKMVNEKVDFREFEFDKLGLRPGDRILDRMVGDLYYIWKPELSKSGVDVLKTTNDTSTSIVLQATQQEAQKATTVIDANMGSSVIQEAQEATEMASSDKTSSVPLYLKLSGIILLAGSTVWLALRWVFSKKGSKI
jgi:hypothetical protein